MVKLRLRRRGRRNYAFYDIVAADSRSPRDGGFIERIGYYDPNTTPSTITINAERALYWLNVGARPTHVVRLLLSYEGILLHRRLMKAGKSPEEIERLVAEHKERVRQRYVRQKRRRERREARRKAASTPAASQPE
ncbi:MAG: 30S ribosomal protein S16 [Candidatus Kapabacteria bacterium]|nr:30S ribosomal protein S16 [Candidatus Kapabacteria bacterium]MCS7169520.1 30S ribosomal protein S16 [Candidatus Kapabacteria bacterium]